MTCEGEPLRVSVCFCLACQRRTGSAYGAQARFPAERARIEGEASTWERVGDSGGRATFVFCPRCAATVCWTVDGLPGSVVVPVGAFADPSFPGPTVSVYEERRHAWAAVPGTVEEHHD